MKALDFESQQRWQFFFAHPDDEAACSALLTRLTANHCPISLNWAHSTEVRKEESMDAVAELGLTLTDAHFAKFPDGDFVDHLVELRAWCRERIEEFHPDRVVCASFEQGHLDHDSLNCAVSKNFDGPIIEFPEYWPYTRDWLRLRRFPNPAGQEILTLSPDELRQKVQVVKCFAMQTLPRNLALYSAVQAIRGEPNRLLAEEPYRIQGEIDYFSPQHEEPLRSRILRSERWKRWVSALKNSGL